MGLITKIFGTRSQREIKKLQPTLDKILALEEPYKALSDEALRAKTGELKQRLSGNMRRQNEQFFHPNMI